MLHSGDHALGRSGGVSARCRNQDEGNLLVEAARQHPLEVRGAHEGERDCRLVQKALGFFGCDLAHLLRHRKRFVNAVSVSRLGATDQQQRPMGAERFAVVPPKRHADQQGIVGPRCWAWAHDVS